MRVLKPEYDELLRAYNEDFGGSCTCFISPPCSGCLHEGNPLNLEENEDAWEWAEPEPVKLKPRGTGKHLPTHPMVIKTRVSARRAKYLSRKGKVVEFERDNDGCGYWAYSRLVPEKVRNYILRALDEAGRVSSASI